MTKFRRTAFVCILFGLSFSCLVRADDSNKYADVLQPLFNAHKYDQALNYVVAELKKSPDDLNLLSFEGQIHHLRGEYREAISAYAKVHMAFLIIKNNPDPDFCMRISQAYVGLGEKSGLTTEIALRTVYYIVSAIEQDASIGLDDAVIKLLRQRVTYSDLLKLGVNIVETDGDPTMANLPVDKINQMFSGKKTSDEPLPDDGVTAEEKTAAKERAVTILAAYDEAHRQKEYAAVPSDKTADELIAAVKAQAEKIKTFKGEMTRTYLDGKVGLKETVVLKRPGAFKIVQPNVTALFDATGVSTIDTQTGSLMRKSNEPQNDFVPLYALGVFSPHRVLGVYDRSVVKLVAWPKFLADGHFAPPQDLYLLTCAFSKDDDGGGAPISRIEFVIDAKRSFCLALREYYHGIVGSGIPEELASEMIVTYVDEQPDGTYFGAAGSSRRYIDVTGDENYDWKYTGYEVNGPVSEKDLGVKVSTDDFSIVLKKAEGGDADAQFAVGVVYRGGRAFDADPKESFRWLLKSAEGGNVEAMRLAAVCYSNGDGTKRDDTKAFEWLKRAAETGDIKAQGFLGAFYEEGVGTKKDPAAGFRWTEKCAGQGDVDCRLDLSRKLHRGLGTTQDKLAALRLDEGLAAQGVVRAMVRVSFEYFVGEIVPADFERSFTWARKAALLGDAEAQGALAECFYFGKGTAADLAQSAYWAQKSASGGDMFGTYDLGMLYFNGEGVSQDRTKAFQLLKKSAEGGIYPAQKMLAVMYERGEGVGADKRASARWEKTAEKNTRKPVAASLVIERR